MAFVALRYKCELHAHYTNAEQKQRIIFLWFPLRKEIKKNA